MSRIDELTTLTARDAYLAMVEFLRTEFELNGSNGEIHLGGLLAEMEPESNGSSEDPGAIEQFVDAVLKVTSPDFTSNWSSSSDSNS